MAKTEGQKLKLLYLKQLLENLPTLKCPDMIHKSNQV